MKKTDKRTCPHWWVKKTRYTTYKIGFGQTKIIPVEDYWACEYCGISEEEFKKNVAKKETPKK